MTAVGNGNGYGTDKYAPPKFSIEIYSAPQVFVYDATGNLLLITRCHGVSLLSGLDAFNMGFKKYLSLFASHCV